MFGSLARTGWGRSDTQGAFSTRRSCTIAGLCTPHCLSSPTVTPLQSVLDSATSPLPTVMSHNGPFELTNGDLSFNNHQLTVPTLPTSLLPSVDLSPPQRRAVGPDRSFTKAALGKPRPAPYSLSRGTSNTPRPEPAMPDLPTWLAPQPTTKRSANEGSSPLHYDTPSTSSLSNRAAGEKDLGF